MTLAGRTIGTAEGESLPARVYQDAGFFDAERQKLFAKSWHLICHVNDIRNAGDYHALDILGEKFLALRGADGVVRSFHNVCRHRGSQICKTETGSAHRLVCPYHRWTYELDGSLVLDTRREFGVDKEGLSLRQTLWKARISPERSRTTMIDSVPTR